MPRTEDIVNSIWAELDSLSNEAMLLYLWSWTNPRCGVAGLYAVPKRFLAEARLDDLDGALAELERANLLLYEDGVLWVRGRVKRWRATTIQSAKSIARDLAEIAVNHPLRIAWMEKYGDEPWLRDHLETLTTDKVRTRFEQGSEKRIDKPNSEPSANLEQGSTTSSSPSTTSSASDLQKNPNPEAFKVLGEIAEVRGAPTPDRGKFLTALAEFPDADPDQAAREFRYWACEGTGTRSVISDVIEGFRRNLGFQSRGRKPDRGDEVEAQMARLKGAV